MRLSPLVQDAMEYTAVEKTVEAVNKDAHDSYSKIMAHEKDALRVVERVSDDMRDRAVDSASLWNTPLSSLMKEYAAFVKQVYTLYMAGDKDAVMERLYTPDGLIGGGITVLIVLLLLALLRT